MKYSKKHDESALVPTVARGAARLLLFAAALALLGGLVLTSTAQATISVKNTNDGTYNGLRGVAATLDTAYFHGVPGNYAPVMEICMNNSWGSNRYLEWKLTFPTTQVPYRHLALCLTVNKSTSSWYAVSDPLDLRPRRLDLSEAYETSTDGYWNAYCDGVLLREHQKWYLHDHGTWAETKVVCPGYPQGEWSRFTDIDILRSDWYWVDQLPPWYPVSVSDDNPYLYYICEHQNDAWHSSALVDDDGVFEVGTWGQSEPAGISPFIDNGFRDQFTWTKYNYDTYVFQGAQQGLDVVERDLREADLPRGVGGGTAATGFDKPDFSLWASHGNYDVLQTNTAEDFFLFAQGNARWGKTDLEWAYICACKYTGWENPDQKNHDYASMAGLHAMCGFRTCFGCPDPDLNNPQNGDDYEYGRRLVQYMKGQYDGVKRTVVEAWEMTARDLQFDPVKWTRCFYTPTTLYDHLPGYGAYAIGDPTGWMMGGLTYWHDSRAALEPDR